MHEHVTVLAPQAPSTGGLQVSDLPADLLAQVRGRIRLLSLLLLVGFAVAPVLFAISWIVGALRAEPAPIEFSDRIGFVLADAIGAVASIALWWIARKEHTSPSRLHTLGLLYEIAICFQIAFTTMWQGFLEKGLVPQLTWVPTVIVLFPLIMPGPPARMLAAAIAAGAMAPIALLVLDLSGKVTPDFDAYFQAILASTFGIGFAYMGARVVYRLGRQVATARELGSYQLEALLGRGGMGEVWRARHRMLARPAAIKLIRPSTVGVTHDMQRRFEHEAQVIASLRSPHTVELFDFGVADNGAFYYVMELLEGLDTDAFIRRFGPLTADRAIFLLRQVCHSLAEAQAGGLVHRDIKPANIFLCQYGEDYDFVKVLDFGLAKAFEVTPDGDTGLTAHNVVKGTPAFIAPEQAMGQAIDGRADIYATGCVAYWFLTGQSVFTADTTMGMILEHARTIPTPPSARTELLIPAALEQIVLACLAKDPGDRPQSARELSMQLGALPGAGDWTSDRAREWWKTHQPAAPIVRRQD